MRYTHKTNIVLIKCRHHTLLVFNTSMFAFTDDYDIKASLHYEDHPVAANDDFLSLSVGTVTLVRVSIEEV